jgi:His/Glu/Gln/Arg/opine family amino acid ABC transporter permease subunit
MFRFSVVVESLPYLLEGLRITLLVTASALLASLVLGFLVGTMRLSSVRIVALSASLFVIVLRNTPLLVQLIWVYYCLPIVFGLGGAYIAEIVRAGIQSIDPGQTEAAKSVGLNYWQTMIHVILPQAIRRIIPPLANEGITLLKYSSLVSTIGVADLTYQAQVVATTTFRPLEIYTALALEYFVLCSALQYCTSRIEAAFADRG